MINETIITYIYQSDNILWEYDNDSYYPNQVITTLVTNMNKLFQNKITWNSHIEYQNISTWDTSNVTNMSYMFHNVYELY